MTKYKKLQYRKKDLINALNEIYINQCLDQSYDKPEDQAELNKIKADIKKDIVNFINEHSIRFIDITGSQLAKDLGLYEPLRKTYKIKVTDFKNNDSIIHYITLPLIPIGDRHKLDLGYVLDSISFDLTDPDNYLDTINPIAIKKANDQYKKAINFYSDDLILTLGGSI